MSIVIHTYDTFLKCLIKSCRLVIGTLPTEANCERVFSRIGNNTWIIRGATRNPRHCPHIGDIVGCYLNNHNDIEDDDEDSSK